MNSIDIIKEAKELQPDVIRWRRHIHQNPEYGLETYKTAAYVAENLKSFGIPDEDIHMMVNGAAVTVVIHGCQEGKCLGIRVDCDALKIHEESGEPFSATGDLMHACGHDGHTAIGLGIAKMFYEHRQELKGTVKVFFQPAEEIAKGAVAMIAEGCLENPHVDAAIGFHSTTIDPRLPEFPCASIGVCDGVPGFACSTAFRVTFHGKGAHGGDQAHLSHDPIMMMTQAYSQIQAILTREKYFEDIAVLSICHMEAGASHNIIPGEAFFEGTIRTLDHELTKYILQRIETICEGTAANFFGDAELMVKHDMPQLKTDQGMRDILVKSAAKIVGEDRVYDIHKPAMGGEDFAFFSQHIPTIHFRHSQRYDDGRTMYAAHGAHYIINEEGFWSAVATTVQFALDWFEA